MAIEEHFLPDGDGNSALNLVPMTDSEKNGFVDAFKEVATSLQSRPNLRDAIYSVIRLAQLVHEPRFFASRIGTGMTPADIALEFEHNTGRLAALNELSDLLTSEETMAVAVENLLSKETTRSN